MLSPELITPSEIVATPKEAMSVVCLCTFTWGACSMCPGTCSNFVFSCLRLDLGGVWFLRDSMDGSLSTIFGLRLIFSVFYGAKRPNVF
jgi:hypothetical protein